jgi:PST family polysaccharide transporter
MNLLRTSAVNGMAVAVRLVTSIGVNKVLAVYVGPSGYGLLGQFQSLISMLGALAGSAFGTGVTKFTAEAHADPQRQHAVWRTASMLSLVGAASLALLLLVARAPLAAMLLNDASLGSVMTGLAIGLLLLSFNALLLAILNGLRQVVPLALAGVMGSVLSAAFTAALVLTDGLRGALLAAALGPGVALLASAFFYARAVGFQPAHFLGRIDRNVARGLGGYLLMALTSAIAVPASLMLVREGLARLADWQLAGLWQALWKLSETHLLLLTTTLSVYFLPRFAQIRKGHELRREVMAGYRFVVPLVMVTASGLYLLRGPVVHALFAPSFASLTEAYGWQLLGDALRIGSWVAAYTMVSHARTRLFIVTELTFAGLQAALMLAGAWRWGLPGAAAGYALTYLMYWIVAHFTFLQLSHRLDRSTAGGT